ncbi:Aminotransferase class V-fold PLP-dependent enzyme [Planctomycetales bacterium 10988]|nr:Aminotransferase class V-fold PLP-dependent enzyme [Planctomycetales bacterium 10988]
MNGLPQPDLAFWEQFRQEMSVTERWIYLDHAAVSPLPRPTAKILKEWTSSLQSDGDIHWPAWHERMLGTKTNAAKLLNAEEDEIALINNTSHGISLVAEGFPWEKGDNLLMLSGEFPANVYPWWNLESRGIETRTVLAPGGVIDWQALNEACDSRTRLLTLSWVGFATGYRQTLGPICEWAQSRGIYLFLDAIQGMGIFPLDSQELPIDFLAADGHKWMLGPEGAGIFFVRKKHLDFLQPRQIGWNSVANPYAFSDLNFQLKTTAGRYESGTYNTVGQLGLGQSLALLSRFGPKAIGDRIIHLVKFVDEKLRSIGATIYSPQEDEHRSGILIFSLPDKDPQALRTRCQEAGIALAQRGPGLRISPHAYNTEEELEQAVEVLKTA